MGSSHGIAEVLMLMTWCVLVQVLSPTKKTPAGTVALNHQLQELLNPPADNKKQMPVMTHPHQHQHAATSNSAAHVWRVGDRVVHLENDPERDVYNGDLGYIESITEAPATRNKRLRLVVDTALSPSKFFACMMLWQRKLRKLFPKTASEAPVHSIIISI